jgi:hypothetical protein
VTVVASGGADRQLLLQNHSGARSCVVRYSSFLIAQSIFFIYIGGWVLRINLCCTRS